MLQTAKSAQEGSSFISFFIRSSPCGSRPETKMKTIGHAVTCHILNISWNLKLSHSVTCTKTLLKGPKGQGILKIELFPG